MKRIYSFVLTLAFTLLVSQAFAWGQLGHYLIGYLAEKQLKKSTLKKVEGLFTLLHSVKVGRGWMISVRIKVTITRLPGIT